MNDINVAERGSASILISLDNGVITVVHGTDNVVLRQWTAQYGDWDKLWDRIKELEEGAI